MGIHQQHSYVKWFDNGMHRTLLNFLVSCPKKTVLINYVTAFANVKDATLLCNLLGKPPDIEAICMDEIDPTFNHAVETKTYFGGHLVG